MDRDTPLSFLLGLFVAILGIICAVSSCNTTKERDTLKYEVEQLRQENRQIKEKFEIAP